MIVNTVSKNSEIAINRYQCQTQPGSAKLGFSYQSLEPQNDRLSFKSIYFTGLSDAMGRQLFPTGKEILDLLNKFPKSEGVVGNLPADWIDHIPVNERKQRIKDVYSAFGQAVNYLRKNLYTISKEAYEKEASQLIKNSLVQAGIMPAEQSLELKRLGAGKYGTGYSINVADKKYLLKVFHEHAKPANEYHGELIETNRAKFVDQNTGKNQFSKFYFADLNNGYDLFQFVDDSIPQPETIVSLDGMGMNYGDNSKDKIGLNIINGYLCDYGGISISSPILAKNKTARWVYKQITKETKPADWNKNWDHLLKQATENHIPNQKDIYIGLAACISFLPEDKQADSLLKLSEILGLPEEAGMILVKYLDPHNEIIKHTHKTLISNLAQNANDQVKKELIETFKYMNHKEAYQAFEILLKNSSDQIKQHIIKATDYVDRNTKFQIFKLIAPAASPPIKAFLNEKARYLLPEQQVELQQIFT